MFVQAKYSQTCAKYGVLDKILIDDLTGNTSDPFSIFNGLICDESYLLEDAKSKKNTQLLEAIYHYNYYRAFYRGDYDETEKMYEVILTLPTSKNPKMRRSHGIFFRGLVAFHFYREGRGEEWQKKGKDALEKMELWLKNSTSTFENKSFLLRAEYLASVCNVSEAMAMYEKAIKSARDHGLIHEQALAYEFMGNFLASIVETSEATLCFGSAYECYMQWGAVVKAEKIRKDHKLDQYDEIGSCKVKHGRDWDE